ncbi:uncharacterized protein N7477_005472 [Penicillium maclennaniae]|uniref:uncharacterized protein n=1 Tax=Penicillium maclennaniae TaxID=1343394 RepID=UPI00253F6602|nr:uncharacterized protein N7477_005472 [Penicillium maclennaniae]KAJ5670109.1 hypothetical protein N7477_005472 [Penicillium maclennaniae]
MLLNSSLPALSFKPEIASTEPTLPSITTPTLPPFSILSSPSRDFLGLWNISRVFRDPFSTSAHAVTIELLGVGRPTSTYLVVESRSSRVQPVKRAVLQWRSQGFDSRYVVHPVFWLQGQLKRPPTRAPHLHPLGVFTSADLTNAAFFGHYRLEYCYGRAEQPRCGRSDPVGRRAFAFRRSCEH